VRRTAVVEEKLDLFIPWGYLCFRTETATEFLYSRYAFLRLDDS